MHLLDETERRAITRIERHAIARAALAGALSALVAGVTESLLQPIESVRPMVFWGVLGAVSVLAAIAEIAFLSWDALRTAHALACAAGVPLDARGDGDLKRREVLAVLARAALEVANPIESDLAINPLRETPRWRLALAGVLYKLKVSATNILIKLVVRRALGRAAVRTWLHFISIPVTALWNAVVCARVLREVRVRVLGPSLVDDAVARLLPQGRVLSPAQRELLPRAVAAAIVRSADLHPNLERLLRAVMARAGGAPDAIDDVGQLLTRFDAASDEDRTLVRALFRVAVVVDGRVHRRERALARTLGVDDSTLAADRARVVHGLPVDWGTFVPSDAERGD